MKNDSTSPLNTIDNGAWSYQVNLEYSRNNIPHLSLVIIGYVKCLFKYSSHCWNIFHWLYIFSFPEDLELIRTCQINLVWTYVQNITIARYSTKRHCFYSAVISVMRSDTSKSFIKCTVAFLNQQSKCKSMNNSKQESYLFEKILLKTLDPNH